MAAFKITNFAGIAPKLSARLLANDVGQEAKDVNLRCWRTYTSKR